MQDLNKKISEFQEIETFGDNAVIPVVQGNPLDNYKITPDNFINSLIESIKDALNLSNVVGESHTHHNKEVLDAITQEMLNKINNGLWELITEDSEGNPLEEPYILTKYSAVSERGVSALGLGEGGEPGTGGDFDRLDKWEDYNETKVNWVLSALLGKDLDTRVGANSSSITDLNQRVDAIGGLDSDKNYIHTQGVPTDTWTIAHTLNKYPSVTIVDSGGTEVIGNIKYVDLSTVSITFSSAFSGRAILN